MEIGKKYLPIGTVVMLKDGTKRVMITGFCSAGEENPNTVWDYTGCLYPEGYLSSNQTCLFNHEQIVEVFHMGLADDDEEKAFKEQMDKLIEAMNAAGKISEGATNVPVEQTTGNIDTSSSSPIETLTVAPAPVPPSPLEVPQPVSPPNE